MSSAGTFAQMSNEKTVEVGGAPMYPSKDIIDNAVNSKDHTTLVAAVKAADLVSTLKGPGPFTVFAPTNAAFAKVSDAVDNLMKPENKAMLVKVLTYHVVPGRIGSKMLLKMIKKAGGKATLKTVQGENLYASADGDMITIWDENGNKSMITTADVWQSNGVIHVVDAVLMPK